MNRPSFRRRIGVAALSATVTAAVGCHSAFVQASVVNRTGHPLPLFEVDYPSASFGSSNLADGATFPYRFKILGEGTAKITWTDASQHEHTAQGPALHEGEEGTFMVTLTSDAASWDPQLHRASR